MNIGKREEIREIELEPVEGPAAVPAPSEPEPAVAPEPEAVPA
jgi:hypothetical protein